VQKTAEKKEEATCGVALYKSCVEDISSENDNWVA
jgi:hypothetical protein